MLFGQWPDAKLTSVMIQSSVFMYMALSISLQSWTTLTPCWRGSLTKSLNGFHCHIYHPPVYQLMVSVWQGQIPHSRVLTVYSVTEMQKHMHMDRVKQHDHLIIFCLILMQLKINFYPTVQCWKCIHWNCLWEDYTSTSAICGTFTLKKQFICCP